MGRNQCLCNTLSCFPFQIPVAKRHLRGEGAIEGIEVIIILIFVNKVCVERPPVSRHVDMSLCVLLVNGRQNAG